MISIVKDGKEVLVLYGQIEVRSDAGVVIVNDLGKDSQTIHVYSKTKRGHYHAFDSRKWIKGENQPNTPNPELKK